MRQNKKILVREWVKRAKDDELNALSILKHRDGTPAMVCFISHQIAEKYLKAFLLFHKNDFPKIHNLVKLTALAKPYISTISKELKNEVILLEPYYIGTRYPADISLESFNWEIAIEAYEAAKKIKDYVLGKIK